MMADPKRDGVAGFTLLEALVATALMGLVLAALATITSQWLPNWNRGMIRVERSEQLALGLDRLASDLSAAEFISSSRETPYPLFDGLNRSVTLVRTALSPNVPPGLEIVRIAESRTDRGPVLVRMRAPFMPVVEGTNERDLPTFTDPVVLLRSPYSLEFSYAGADRVWRDTWQGAALLPKAVKLTVRQSLSQQILSVSTASLVHAELPARCVSAKSLAECLGARREPGPAESDKAREIGDSRLR